MKTDAKQFILDYIDAMNKGPITLSLLDKYIAESDIELKNYIIALNNGIPNYKGDVEDIVAEGDKVVVLVKFKGIHKGNLFGQPPTNKPVEISGIVIYHVKNEKIINHWFRADSLSLMQQIGGIPATTPEEEIKTTRMNNYSVLITNKGKKFSLT